MDITKLLPFSLYVREDHLIDLINDEDGVELVTYVIDATPSYTEKDGEIYYKDTSYVTFFSRQKELDGLNGLKTFIKTESVMVSDLEYKPNNYVEVSYNNKKSLNKYTISKMDYFKIKFAPLKTSLSYLFNSILKSVFGTRY